MHMEYGFNTDGNVEYTNEGSSGNQYCD